MMKNMTIFFTLVLILLTDSENLYSEENHPDVQVNGYIEKQNLKDTALSRTERFRIFYRINDSEIDTTYLRNRESLEYIRYSLKNYRQIDSIIIYSCASPDGPWLKNRRLSRERGLSARKFLLENASGKYPLDEGLIRLDPEAENWNGLAAAVRSRYGRADIGQVLDIVGSADLTSEEKKAELKKLPPESWRFIRDSLLNELRYAEWVCTWQHIRHRIPSMKAQLALPSELPQPEYRTLPPEEYRKTILAFKTNLLYDAVTWLNYSIEVPFAGNRFSITFDHQFPWWRGGMNRNEFCMRYLQIGGEFRWWFHPRKKPSTKHEIVRDRLSGHFLAGYGMGGKWDFENRRKICYQGEFWSAGITYGYALPVSRHLNMEFSISIGYASIPYRHFIPSDDYSILFRDPNDTGTLQYFGPTKIGVSLVVPISIKRTRQQ